MNIALHNSNISFRVPSGTLPIDIDIMACTIIMVSITTILSSLETLVPHMYAFNAFERSRHVRGKMSLKQFYRVK